MAEGSKGGGANVGEKKEILSWRDDLSPSEELARIKVTDGEIPVDKGAAAAYAAMKPAEASQVRSVHN